MRKLTRPQEFALIGALLYGVLPIVFTATAISMEKAGFLTFDNLGNYVLTQPGKTKAKVALAKLSKLKRTK